MPNFRRAASVRSAYAQVMHIEVTSASGTVDDTVRRDVEAIDQSLRQSFAGLDEGVILDEVRRSFEHLDVVVPDKAVRAYAVAIRERADFVLVLD